MQTKCLMNICSLSMESKHVLKNCVADIPHISATDFLFIQKFPYHILLLLSITSCRKRTCAKFLTCMKKTIDWFWYYRSFQHQKLDTYIFWNWNRDLNYDIELVPKVIQIVFYSFRLYITKKYFLIQCICI